MRVLCAVPIICKVLTTLLFSHLIVCSALAESLEFFDTNNGGPGLTSDLTVLEDELLFFTDDDIHGLELWKTDGTQENTRLVKDIFPGPNGSYSSLRSASNRLHPPTILDGKLFFFADDGVNGISLWASDGTEQGTNLVKDFSPDIDNQDYLFKSGNMLIFSKSDGSSRQVWKSDGTSAGTMLADATARFLNYPKIGNEVIFSMDRSDVGWELFKTDGTEAGTVLVKNINPDDEINQRQRDSSPNNFVELNGEVYFWAYEIVGARNLWKTDGTTAGTVKIPNSSIGGSHVRRMWAVNGKLVYFLGENQSTEEAMYVNDLSGNPSQEIRGYPRYWAGRGESILIKDILYFSAGSFYSGWSDPSDTGIELWKTDGTVAGTELVKDIYPGIGNNGVSNYPYSSDPGWFSKIHNILYFVAKDAPDTQYKFDWKFVRSDGTSVGTYFSFTDFALRTDEATLYKDRVYMPASESRFNTDLNWKLAALDLTSILNVSSSGVASIPIAANLPGFAGVTSYTVEDIDPTTELVLTAPAQSGIHILDGWSGCDSVVGQDCFIKLKNNTDLTANYVLPRFELTVNSPDAPSVQIQSSPFGFGGVTDAGVYTVADIEWGTVFNLIAQETYGALYFGNWSGCDSTSGLNCTVNMTSERVVSASYNPVAVRLTGPSHINSLSASLTLDVSVLGKYPTGYILIKDDGAEVPGCRLLFLEQQTTQCEITFDNLFPGDHVFTAEYSGDSDNVPASGSLSVSVDKSIDPSLSVFKPGSGSGRVTSNSGYIDCGNKCLVRFPAGSATVITLTASSDSGSTFNGWEGAGCSGKGSCSIRVDSVKGVNAVFTDDSLTNFSKPVGSCNGITGNYANKTIDNESIVCIADTQTNLGGNLTVRNKSSVRMKAPVNTITAPFSMVDSTLSITSTPPLPAGSNKSVIAPTGNPANPLMLVKRDGTSALFHYSAFDERYTGLTLKSPQDDVMLVKLWPEGHLKHLYFNGYIFSVSKVVNGLVDVLATAPDGATELFKDISITSDTASGKSFLSKIQSVVNQQGSGIDECDENPDGYICGIKTAIAKLRTGIRNMLLSLVGSPWDGILGKAADFLENIEDGVNELPPEDDIGTSEEAGEMLDCEPGPTFDQCFYGRVYDQEDYQDSAERLVADRMEQNQPLLAESDKFDMDDYATKPTVIMWFVPQSTKEAPGGSGVRVRVDVYDDAGISKLIYHCPNKSTDSVFETSPPKQIEIISPPAKQVFRSFTCVMPEYEEGVSNIYNVSVDAINVADLEGIKSSIIVVTKPENEVEVSLVALDSTASEQDESNQAVFEVRRSDGDGLESALTLFYTISGSADNGIDYVQIGNSVTIPENKRSVKIYVTAIDDNIDDPDQTVTLTLNPVATEGITISDNFEATVTIVEKTVACGSLQLEGGDSSDSRTIDLGKTGRDFVFTWEAFTKKDSFSLSFGSGSYTTECVSGSGSVTRNSGTSDVVTVTVSPNCEGTTGTKWEYTLACP